MCSVVSLCAHCRFIGEYIQNVIVKNILSTVSQGSKCTRNVIAGFQYPLPPVSASLALQQAMLGTAEVLNSALRLIALVRVLQNTTAMHLEAVNSFITKAGDRESVQGSGGSSPAGGTDDGMYEGNEGDQYE